MGRQQDVEDAREAAADTLAAVSVSDYLSLCDAFPTLRAAGHPSADGIVKLYYCGTPKEKKRLLAALFARRPDLKPKDKDENATDSEPAGMGQEQPELR